MPQLDTSAYNAGENPDHSPVDGFVGVSPEYRNYANETDKPLEGDPVVDSPDKVAAEGEDDGNQRKTSSKGTKATKGEPEKVNATDTDAAPARGDAAEDTSQPF